MKKKQVIIVAAALAVVLLTGTAVYAIGNLSPESNQVDKPVEQPPLSSAAAEARGNAGAPYRRAGGYLSILGSLGHKS